MTTGQTIKVDEDEEEGAFEEITLSDGEVFRLWDGDAEWDPIALGIAGVAEKQQRLDELPSALDEVSERLLEFRRSAGAARRLAWDVVKRVEELDGGGSIRGKYRETPHGEFGDAADVFVQIITDRMGAIALGRHADLRLERFDLDGSREWVAQRDEALRIKATAAVAN